MKPPQRDILAAVGISNFLAVETVRRRERACGRLIVSKQTGQQLLEAITRAELFCRIGRHSFVETDNLVSGTHHSGSFSVRNDPGAKAVVYFGISNQFAEGVEDAEVWEQHSLVGRLFGYPDCCVTAFTNIRGRHADKLPDLIPHAGPFSALMNPVVPYLYPGLSLLFHFPCSPDCLPSQKLARGRLQMLSAISPMFEQVTQLGAGIAFYGQSVGIGLADRYRMIASGEFECERVITHREDTRAVFTSVVTPVVQLINGRRFKIGNRAFSLDHQFAARFE